MRVPDADGKFDRVFSEDELRIASMRSVDALAEALASEDFERAVQFSKRLRYETLAMLGSYDGWQETLLAWVSRREDDATVETLRSQLTVQLEGQCPAPISDNPEQTLREMARAIAVSIEAGDRDTALARANTLQGAALAHHDRGMSRVTAILTWIGNRYDVASFEDALAESMSAGLLGDASFRERAEALMHYTRVHLHSFELKEDAEKLTFVCPVCPSGGRLLQQGQYEARHLGMHVKGPRPFTYGRRDLPVYCCHEPAVEIDSIKKTGVPMFIVEPSENLGVEPCKTYLYKDPADIPSRYYERLGLTKPNFDPPKGSSQ